MAATRQRGVSGVTMTEFFTAVLRGLNVPVTQNNLTKLASVARLEGHGGDYNPFNYILGPGTNFNSVGVKNYPDVNTGIAQTVKLLSQKNTTAMRNSLAADDAYANFTNAASRFYQSWGGPSVKTTANNAASFLSAIVDGPAVPASMKMKLGTGGVTASSTEAPPDWAGIKKWQNEQEGSFNSWLGTQDAGRQQQVISEINTHRELGDLAKYMDASPPEIVSYIQYLSKLPEQAQAEARSRIAPAAGAAGAASPGAAPADPAASKELTDLLSTFGVSYPNAPQPTPALLAFLRGVGLNVSTAEDVKRRAIERIGAATSDAMADIDRSAGRAKQNITADLQRRGVLSSGESNTRYARQAEDVAASKSDVQRGAAQAGESAEDAYRSAADLARQQALDRVIGAEQDQFNRTASSAAQSEAYKRQQEAEDLAWQRQKTSQDESVKRQEELMKQYATQGVVV
jgi:hypothetical protein